MTTTHLALIWSDDYDDWWITDCSPGEYEDASGAFEADVDTGLWERIEQARADLVAAEQAVIALADVEAGCRSQPCDEWQGHTSPARSWWVIGLTSVSENEWPARDTTVGGHFDTEADAQAFIDSLPDEFITVPGLSRAVLISKDRLSVARHGYPESRSSCERCGWARPDHVEASAA